MHTLLNQFINFAEIHGIAVDAFIVGGAVRDIFLNKELKDVDIAMKSNAIDIAQKFAKETGSSFVLLDKGFQIARVVKKDISLDIATIRGDSIYTDLSERDITINAMAIPLTSFQSSACNLQPFIVIDPYNGKYDILHKIIRMVSEENLIKDPLRILRIYRFAATLDFSIEEKTLNAVKRLASLIKSTAAERIAEELRYIVRLDNSYKTMEAMTRDSILSHIFPEINSGFKVKGLKLYKGIEDILSNLLPCFLDYAEAISKYFETDYRGICSKLSTLFPDAESAKSAAIKLKMSRKEVRFIYNMALNRNEILNFYRQTEGSPDEIETVRLLKKYRDDVYALTILGMAQEPMIASFCKKLIGFYEDVFKPRAALLPIITGNDLINTFNLKPSSIFKELLTEIEDMILYGRISSKEEALKMAEEMLKNKS